MDASVRRKRGWRQFTVGMAVYVVVVLVQGFLLEPGALTPPLALGAALLPMVPVIWAMFGWLEAVRSYDELQQRIFGHAGLLALGITATATFSYGFLEAYLGAPRLSMFAGVPLIAVGFMFGTWLSRRRYR